MRRGKAAVPLWSLRTGAPCSHQRTWAEEDGAQPYQCSCRADERFGAEGVNSDDTKAFEKIVIGPCTLVRPGFPARCISQIRVCGFL